MPTSATLPASIDANRAASPSEPEAMCSDNGCDGLTAQLLRYGATRNLWLYARTGQREFVWRVWREFRQAGHPIPEAVLRIVDEWVTERPGRRAAKLIRNAERDFDVVQNLHIREHELGQRAGESAVAVAADFGLDTGYVRVIKSRARKRARSSRGAASASAAGGDLQGAWPSVVTPDGGLT